MPLAESQRRPKISCRHEAAEGYFIFSGSIYISSVSSRLVSTSYSGDPFGLLRKCIGDQKQMLSELSPNLVIFLGNDPKARRARLNRIGRSMTCHLHTRRAMGQLCAFSDRARLLSVFRSTWEAPSPYPENQGPEPAQKASQCKDNRNCHGVAHSPLRGKAAIADRHRQGGLNPYNPTLAARA